MTRMIGLFCRKGLAILSQVSLALLCSVSIANAAITACSVNTTADDPASASATVTASTTAGTLRDCMLAANLLTGSTGEPTLPGMAITFAPALSGATIALGNDLPLLFNNTSIDASALANPVTIDGGSLHRIFFVSGLPPIPMSGKPDIDGSRPTTVSLRHLQLAHGHSQGGDTNGGGGGMGAGGALFINKSATVTLENVGFASNAALGGNVSGTSTVSGGGGMGAGINTHGGGGLGSHSVAIAYASGAGLGTSDTFGGTGGGWGGQGLGQLSNVQGFNPAYFDVDSGTGTSGLGLIGGGASGSTAGASGGFGGGGGYEGHGGFGGGGGYGSTHDGAGGFGGGGGANGFGPGGFGGGGGDGNSDGGGIGGGVYGGGAGFGGAVFVRSGASLTVKASTSGVGFSGGSVTAGTGINSGAAKGSGLFVMSGATTLFDIAGSYAISDTLADDSSSTLPASQSFVAGAGIGTALTKQGSGVLTLSGINTYAGATTVNDGVLRLVSPGSIQTSTTTVGGAGTVTGDGTTGPLDSSGTLAPGTIGNPQGTLHVIGALHIQLGALTCFHANGANAVSDLNATGGATLNGIARIDFSGSPAAGTIYFPMTAASITGTFAGYETNMPNLLGHFSYGATSVTFTVDASDVVFRNGLEESVSDSPCIAAFAI